ncbi:glycosyltransferase family 9 protein [Desulfosarcina widdelii]|uniref:glycosyltransferase family 9 protein n=1 Tax=Desulfosarcina widdelii TaxID=947919 RepID=UPI0012D362E5|nr:glycosyltransferase family 9 protein [Desulfosarcina widdelii]
MMPEISQRRVKRVLVYRLGSMGDTIVALPSLRLVAQAFPKAQRWMLTNFRVSEKAVPMAQLLENTGLIHGYIQYPLKLSNPCVLAALLRRIRSMRPEIMVYLAEPRGLIQILRDVIFFKLCGIQKLIGVPYMGTLQRPARMANDSYEYVGSRLLRCLQSLGKFNIKDPSAFDLYLTPFEHASAETALKSIGINRSFIAASIGAKVDVKDWGDENWSLLFAKLGRELKGWSLVMVGSADERKRTSQVLRSWPGNSLNLCGQLSVRESAAVLSLAHTYVGHDSGPMHLAAAAGTTCVAIFSSRNMPGEWFPPGDRHTLLYRTVSCMGCRREVCEDLNKRCIQSISVDEVFGHVLRVLNTECPSN